MVVVDDAVASLEEQLSTDGAVGQETVLCVQGYE